MRYFHLEERRRGEEERESKKEERSKKETRRAGRKRRIHVRNERKEQSLFTRRFKAPSIQQEKITSRANKKHTIAFFLEHFHKREKHNRNQHSEEEGLLRELNPGPLAP